MRAGTLDRQITVERKSVTPDPDYGTEVVAWLPLVTAGSPPLAVRFAAQVLDIPPAKAEALQQGLVVARNPTRVRMRYRTDIDSSMRIVVHGDGDRLLAIVGGPAMMGRKDLMEFLCEEFAT